MQLDNLKEVWKEEIEMKANIDDFEQVRSNVDRFDRRAKTAWIIELLACAAVVLFVTLFWVTADSLNLLLQLGMLTMILSAVFIAVKITWGRKVSTVDDWTLAAKLKALIEKREKEVKLLSTVAYWYLSPLLLAIFLMSYGGYVQRTGIYVPDAGLWIYWALCIVLYVAIYFFNIYQIKNRVQPILDQLYALRDELEA